MQQPDPADRFAATQHARALPRVQHRVFGGLESELSSAVSTWASTASTSALMSKKSTLRVCSAPLLRACLAEHQPGEFRDLLISPSRAHERQAALEHPHRGLLARQVVASASAPAGPEARPHIDMSAEIGFASLIGSNPGSKSRAQLRRDEAVGDRLLVATVHQQVLLAHPG